MSEILSILKEIRLAQGHLRLVEDNLELTYEGDVFDKGLLEKIRTHKVEIIEYFREHSSGISSIIPKAESLDGYPLSYSQRRLWMIEQMYSGSNAYNISAAYRIYGNLNINKIKNAVGSLVQRHESLRTIFREVSPGNPEQYILSYEQLNDVFTFSDFTVEDGIIISVDRILKDIFSFEFNLTKNPLIKISLFKIGSNEFILGYVMHHIVGDGWSLELIIKELMDFYRRDNTELENLRIQYKDFAVWQQSLLIQPSFERASKYWRNQFIDLPMPLQLDVNGVRPKVRSFNGHRISMSIGAAELNRIDVLCKSNNCSLFIGMLATLNVLLFRYSDQKDIIIGTPVSGRDHSDLADQVGFYVNTLPLRNQLSGKDRFIDVLLNVKNNTIEAFKNQHYPFDLILDSLPNLQYDNSRNPLFDILLSVQDDKSYSLIQQGVENGISIERMSGAYDKSKFDLTFDFVLKEGEVILHLGYNTDLFDVEFVEALGNNFKSLLSIVTLNPEKSIETIDYVNQYAISQSSSDIEVEDFIDVFEKQVKSSGEEVAVEYNNTKLTYLQLDELSNRLANYLLKEGLGGKNSRIGVIVPPSEWTVIIILAILKIDCVYVPIDPAYPIDRRNGMLLDAQCRFVIDSDFIDNLLEKLNSYSKIRPLCEFLKNHIAYIIFTSGSSGRPKGVMVTRRNFSAFIGKCIEDFKVDYNPVMPLLASTSFDISLFEIFFPLINGGRLFIIDTKVVKDVSQLVLLCKSWTSLHAVPTLMEQLFNEIKELELYPAFMNLFIGGDSVPTNLLIKMRTISPKATINVLYGPTEATIFVSSHVYPPQTNNFNGASLGYPNHLSSVFILDRNLLPVPFGIQGEICLGGEGISAGYLNGGHDKFIHSKYGRIYRTGDMGRFLRNGSIEFRGRLDGQVKIRGFRIELGEIEQVTKNYPGIKKAIVITKQTKEEKLLEMYIISTLSVSVTALKRFLREHLPVYMIPSRIFHIDAFPLTHNGKIDKARLSEMPKISLENEILGETAQTQLQKDILSIWKEVLQIEYLSIHDNFFDIGGSSISIIKVSRLLSAKLAKNIPVTLLFEFPTISLLAHCIEGEVSRNDDEFFPDRDELLSDLNKFN